MRDSFFGLMMTVGVATAAGMFAVSSIPARAQPPDAPTTMPAGALKTAWGEPDLQGIWTDENDTPLQRLAKYANQEFFTEAQRAELDQQRSALLSEDAGGHDRA
jgi:hypothetical protein